MKSFYLFRNPGSNSFSGGTGVAVNSIETGFIISSFHNDPLALQTIKKERDFSLSDLKEAQSTLFSEENRKDHRMFPFPERPTLKSEHLERLFYIIRNLKPGEKTVCCRIISGAGTIDLEKTLLSLDVSFPRAFIFCFYTPSSGLWIGASPEKLLAIKGNKLSTVALAGTREAGCKEEWDNKNKEEQQLVVDYIAQVLSRHQVSFSHNGKPETVQAGSIEHLCTFFDGVVNKEVTLERLKSILFDLSPTPALCGYPKEKGMKLIEAAENFERGYYGGFLGEIKENGDCSLYVLLRAVRVEEKRWCMFAGGGITVDSNPDAEWDETENKGKSIISKLLFS